MIVKKAHKIKLNPTAIQAQYFWKACGVSRFAWNWGLAEYNRLDGKVKITGKGDTLKARFTALKNRDLPWVSEVTTYAQQQAFIDLQSAIKRYFDLKKRGELKKPKGCKGRKDGKPFGWPRFKAKGRAIPSFYESNQGLKFDGFWVSFPKLGWVNMCEQLRFDGRVLGSRITHTQGHWWLSVQVETEIPEPDPDHKGAVGVDLGVKYLATLSNGEQIPNPRPFYQAQRKLRRLQRKLDRQRRANNPDNYDEKGSVKRGLRREDWRISENMKKTEAAITTAYARVTNIRREISHELTTEIAQNYSLVAIETLNIKGMMSNRHLSKAIGDAAMYEKRRQLEYKTNWQGGVVLAVDQWFPSSKMCHNCKEVNFDLKLADRVWICKGCGGGNERDINAAKNIRDEALKTLSGSIK